MRGLERVVQHLWSGPLPDPDEPQRTILAALPDTDYAQVLAALRLLCACALPLDTALAPALARWPWSIDLALVMVDAAGDGLALDTALETLQTRISTQNRRRAAFGWAAWRAGRAGVARDFMAHTDPASQTFATDIACRAELALLDADWTAADADLAQLRPWRELWQRVALQQVYLRDGAAALARHVEGDAALPGAHWRQIFDLYLSERDFARARNVFEQARARLAPVQPEMQAAEILLALDTEMPELALARLAPTLAPEPCQWTPRQHIQWLRAILGCARLDPAPQEQLARAHLHADAAQRLHARNPALRSLWLTCRELTDDWDDLARDMARDMACAPGGQHWPVAHTLNRLGLHDAALVRLQDALRATEGANPRARALLALAETRLLAGDPQGAMQSLDTAAHLMPPAPTRADLALQRAEVLLWQGQPDAAHAVLAGLHRDFPQRMGLWLTQARIAFYQGNFGQAEAALDRFRALKTAQTGQQPPVDLRDRIVADALAASHALPDGLLSRPVGEVIAQAGVERIAAAPGLSACLLARAWPGVGAAFVPLEGAPIPRRIAHYWEGPRSSAVERGIAAWRRQHPGFSSTVYGPAEAAAWIGAHHPGLLQRFVRQTQPATRADLFRIALILTEGGLYADVDEYPRAPVDDWLDGASAVFCIECGHGTIANNFLAARPGLPVFRRMLERVQGLLATTDTPYPWWHSGPAPLTASVFEAVFDPVEVKGLRLLDQAGYCARVSTNLPFPHKRSALHWR